MGSSLKVGGVKGILVGLKEPKGIIFVALEGRYVRPLYYAIRMGCWGYMIYSRYLWTYKGYNCY